MSALPPKADIAKHVWDVRFVPKPDIRVDRFTRKKKSRRHFVVRNAVMAKGQIGDVGNFDYVETKLTPPMAVP
jgi:hypothetical protein